MNYIRNEFFECKLNSNEIWYINYLNKKLIKYVNQLNKYFLKDLDIFQGWLFHVEIIHVNFWTYYV